MDILFLKSDLNLICKIRAVLMIGASEPIKITLSMLNSNIQNLSIYKYLIKIVVYMSKKYMYIFISMW